MAKETQEYRNLARKYRPPDFSGIVGQDATSKTIANALKMGRIAHAYLFHGPRGCGKTTTARVLAKALNCTGGKEDRPNPEPCGKCPACVEIAEGRDMDVLELDAASNTQVEKVRELIIDTVSLSAARDRYKIFILDEVHMLSGSSFNALLKTIEEPPPHVVFILATTERHKIPATIASRCQSFRFRPIPPEQIISRLSSVAEQEGLKIEPAALELIAKSSGGALRDALTLLDRAVSHSESAITAQIISEMLGYMPEDLLKQAAAALLSRNAEELHKAFLTVRDEGHDPLSFLRDIKNAMADIFFYRMKYGKPPFSAMDPVFETRNPSEIANMARRITRLMDEVRFSDVPLISAEMGLFTIMQAVPDVEKWLKRLEEMEQKLGPDDGTTYAAPEPRPEQPRPQMRETAAEKPAPAVRQPVETPKPPAPAAQPAVPARQDIAEPADQADGIIWKKLLDRIAQKTPFLHGMMEKARLDCSVPGKWTLNFQDEFQMESAERNSAKIETALKEISGKAIQLSFAVAKAEKKTENSELIAGGEEETVTEISEEEPLTDEKGEKLVWEDISGEENLAENPQVKRVLKAIPGKVIPPPEQR